MKTRPELPAYGLAALLVAAIAALAGVHVTVPTVLPYALLGVLGVAGGVTLPALINGISSPTSTSAEPLSATQPAETTAPQVLAPPALAASPSAPAPVPAPVPAPTVTPAPPPAAG